MYQIFRRGTGSYLAGGAAGVLFLAFYAAMVGPGVSVIRALIMFLFRVGADMAGRRYDPATACAAAAAIVLFWRPLSIYDGGFWLSFGAVLSLIAVFPFFRELRFQAVWSSISIQIVMFPILLYYFYEVPPYSLLLNLYVIPLMSVLLAAGILGNLLLPVLAPAGLACFQVCRWILRVYETSCEWALRLPGARFIGGQPELWQVVVYYMLLAVMLALLWTARKRQKEQKEQKEQKKWRQRPGIWLIWPAACFILCWPLGETGTFRVTVLDVGQGDGIFLKGPKGGAYLIDGGSSDVKKVGQYRLEPFLKSQGIPALDYVFITHGDADHVSGVEELMERRKVGIKIHTLVLPVQEVWDESLKELAEKAGRAGIKVVVMKPGQSVGEEELKITCLAPSPDGGLEPGNEASMVLAAHYEGFDMLFTGDIEGRGEEILTEKLQKDSTEWEVLKTAHHGSKNSTSDAFLEAVLPSCAVISAGEGNSYGHPHAETIERLKEQNARIYTTKETGAVQINVSEGRITVELNQNIQYTAKRIEK